MGWLLNYSRSLFKVHVILSFFSFLLFSFEVGDAPIPLSFSILTAVAEEGLKKARVEEEAFLRTSLALYHERPVQLGGFLLKGEKGEWLIASQPSLRSCCIGSKNRASLFVLLLEKTFDDKAIGSQITVEGRFVVKVERNEVGGVSRLFQLETFSVVEDKKGKIDPYPWISLASFAAIALLVFTLYSTKKRRRL